MKKTMAMFAVATVAFSAQAAQINWGSQGGLFNGAEQMRTSNGYSTTAYLVYLGTSGASWGGFDATAPIAVGGDVLATATATTLGTVSQTASPYGFNWGDTVGAGSDVMTDGVSTFGVVFISTGGAFGATLHYYLSNTFTVDTSDTTLPGAWDSGTSTFAYGQAVPSGSTWTPVPEPGTAALALAGLALLIRRRR